jgi:hypothetical protein
VRIGTPVKIVYQPVVFGYRPDDGIVYLAHHPDPYELGAVDAREVRDRLAEWGLAELADEQAVSAALQMPRGIPTPVVGSSVEVAVDGRPIKFALAPIPRGDDWLVPAGPLASALGAGLDIGPDGNFVSMERDRQRVFLSPGDREALVNGQVVELSAPPQLAAGYPLVPVAAVARALGASVGFDQASNTVLIWDGARGYGWAR